MLNLRIDKRNNMQSCVDLGQHADTCSASQLNATHRVGDEVPSRSGGGGAGGVQRRGEGAALQLHTEALHR